VYYRVIIGRKRALDPGNSPAQAELFTDLTACQRGARRFSMRASAR
jgi:hypothetical protein